MGLAVLDLLPEEVEDAGALVGLVVDNAVLGGGLEEQIPEVEEATLVLAVVLLEHGLDGLGGLLGVVERQVREDVVRHVGVDDVMRLVVAEPAQRTINSAESTPEERRPSG